MEILNFRPSQISTYGPETNLDGYRGLSWVGLTGIYADFGILGFWRPPLAYWNRPPRAKIVKSPLMTLQGPFKGGRADRKTQNMQCHGFGQNRPRHAATSKKTSPRSPDPISYQIPRKKKNPANVGFFHLSSLRDMWHSLGHTPFGPI